MILSLQWNLFSSIETYQRIVPLWDHPIAATLSPIAATAAVAVAITTIAVGIAATAAICVTDDYHKVEDDNDDNDYDCGSKGGSEGRSIDDCIS